MQRQRQQRPPRQRRPPKKKKQAAATNSTSTAENRSGKHLGKLGRSKQRPYRGYASKSRVSSQNLRLSESLRLWGLWPAKVFLHLPSTLRRCRDGSRGCLLRILL